MTMLDHRSSGRVRKVNETIGVDAIRHSELGSGRALQVDLLFLTARENMCNNIAYKRMN